MFPVKFNQSLNQLILLFTLTTLTISCGEDGGKKSSGTPRGEVEALFYDAAARYQIPARYLLAVAYKESRIEAAPVGAKYLVTRQDQQDYMGIDIAETAFGLPFQTMGLTEETNRETLATQVDYYAKYLSEEFSKIELSPNPRTADEKIQWILEISKLHRPQGDRGNNVGIVFARELINTLNSGFTWKDSAAENEEIIQFAKEDPPIHIEDLRVAEQNLLRLLTHSSEISTAVDFPLSTFGERGNVPTRVEVIHCPFNLSACLEIQNRTGDDNQVRLGAHYVIPSSYEFLGDVKKPLQIAQHNMVVHQTDVKGNNYKVKNAVIVMLTGNSGRLVRSERIGADPTWITDEQLRDMGIVVSDICVSLKQNEYIDDVEACRSGYDQRRGVVFHRQGSSEAYRFGQIPDFDESIFYTYLDKPFGLEGASALLFQTEDRVFKAGAPIDFKVQFQITSHKVEIERLERCSAEKFVWVNLETRYVRSDTSLSSRLQVYDSGPNGNGTQFVRVKIYDEYNDVMGWSIEKILIRDFEEGMSFAPLKYCRE